MFDSRTLRNMTRVIAVLCMLIIAQQRAAANGLQYVAPLFLGIMLLGGLVALVAVWTIARRYPDQYMTTWALSLAIVSVCGCGGGLLAPVALWLSIRARAREGSNPVSIAALVISIVACAGLVFGALAALMYALRGVWGYG